MLSFFEALDFALHKRTFILGLIPIVLMVMGVLGVALFSDQVAAFFSQLNVAVLPLLLMKIQLWIRNYFNDISFWALVFVIVEIFCAFPKGILDAYFVIKAKKIVYEQDVTIQAPLFFKVFSFFWIEETLKCLCLFFVGVGIGFYFPEVRPAVHAFLEKMHDIHWILYYICIFAGPLLILYVLNLINIPYIMNFNFWQYGKKLVGCLKNPLVMCQTVLAPYFIFACVYGLIKLLTIFASSEAILGFLSLGCLIGSLFFATGRYIFILYTSFMVLVIVGIVGMITYKTDISLEQIWMMMSSISVAYYFHLYLICYGAFFFLAFMSVGVFAFTQHYVAQGALHIHQKVLPRQFDQSTTANSEWVNTY